MENNNKTYFPEKLINGVNRERIWDLEQFKSGDGRFYVVTKDVLLDLLSVHNKLHSQPPSDAGILYS